MTKNPDRFDRMLLAAARPVPPPSVVAVIPRKPPVVARVPVITSTRGPRFVDYMPCPMCGHERVGIEFHGQLMSGAKVHQLFAHSPGVARRVNSQPRCLGAGMRVVFEGGVWKGAQAQ